MYNKNQEVTERYFPWSNMAAIIAASFFIASNKKLAKIDNDVALRQRQCLSEGE
mgnify:CR=1 FL=1